MSSSLGLSGRGLSLPRTVHAIGGEVTPRISFAAQAVRDAAQGGHVAYLAALAGLIGPQRRIAGVTTNPNGAWDAQQARNLARDDAFTGISFLIRDRDTKTSAFTSHG
jgi:hypothetical protein